MPSKKNRFAIELNQFDEKKFKKRHGKANATKFNRAVNSVIAREAGATVTRMKNEIRSAGESKLVKRIQELEEKLGASKDRLTSKDYYQGAALGAIVASVIWIALILIF